MIRLPGKTTKRSRLLFRLFTLVMTLLACSLSAGPAIRDYGAASEIQGEYWFHVKRPLTLAGLHGRVVLVGVWKFT